MRGRKEKPRDSKKLIQKDIFTTFDVSRICQANIASIKNWIMKGYLKAFRTPGGHYRIQKRDLVNFLRKYHMPNPFSGEVMRLYFFSPVAANVEKLAQKLSAEHECFAYSADADLFLAVGEQIPDALVVDTEDFEGAALKKFMAYIKGNAKFEGIKLVAIAPVEEPIEGFQKVVKKGAQGKRIVEAIQEIL